MENVHELRDIPMQLVFTEPIDSNKDDDLVNQLIATNEEFRALLARAASRPTKPFDLASLD